MRLTLHQEGQDDVSASVQPVIRLGEGTDSPGLQSGSRGHGVLSTDTDTVDELGPGVTDDPSVKGGTPRSGEHEKTERHDEGVLDETELSADPVAFDTDHDLTEHDTDGLQVGDLGWRSARCSLGE